MNTIDVNIPVAEVIEKNPEVLDLLVELGFKPLTSSAMRNSVGKLVSIKKGASMHGMRLETIKQTLEFNGYEVVGIDG